MNILITGACGVTSRAVVRSLMLSDRFGSVRFIGTDLCGNAYPLHEGLYAKVYRVPPASDGGYLGLVRHILAREAIDVAVVNPESEVLLWSEAGLPVKTLVPPPRFSHLAISKKRVYETLAATSLVPEFSIASREDLLNRRAKDPAGGAVWLRDVKEPSSSGKGAILVRSLDEMRAWAVLCPTINEYMIAEYLPGRNLACCLLFHDNRLVKVAMYERLQYFMGRVAISGVTGNIARGRLINDRSVVDTAEKAIRMVAEAAGEAMHGLVTVDLKEDAHGTPMVTEINLRHVACTYAFAQAGANMAEAQLCAALGDLDGIGELETQFPPDNVILRDIDGPPIWLDHYRDLDVGESQ